MDVSRAPKDLPAGQAGRPGVLADLLVLLVVLLVLPVDQAGHLEGAAEHDGPRKAWSELGKAWIEPRKGQQQPKSEHGKQNGEHRKDKRVSNAVIHECREVSCSKTGLPLNSILGNSEGNKRATLRRRLRSPSRGMHYESEELAST